MEKIPANFQFMVKPSEIINEYRKNIHLTARQFARKMNLNFKTTKNLLHGKIEITDEIAEKLDVIFDTGKAFWFNLQNIYNKKENN